MNQLLNVKWVRIIFRLVLILLCILSVALITIFIFVLTHVNENLVVTDYTVEAGLINPIRIVQLTDLHNAQFGKNNRELIELVNKQNPDIIAMTGDMINKEDEDIHVICNLVKELSTVADVYYGMGNHEVSWIKTFGDRLKQELTEAGAIIVDEECLNIEINGNPVCLGGYMGYYRTPHMLSASEEEQEKDVEFMDEFEASERYKILLNHIPTNWVDWGYLDNYDVDLVFCGHYHGGIIQFPIVKRGLYAPYIGWFPEHIKGEYTGTYGTCILSTGLGSEYVIPRINNPPEIVVVDLY